MSIRIDKTKCIGCEKCSKVCPGSLIEMKDHKACIVYPKDCWGCASCVKECPKQAIDFFLGADIGGKGSTLNVTKEGDILHWNISRFDGEQIVIDIDSKDSNKY